MSFASLASGSIPPDVSFLSFSLPPSLPPPPVPAPPQLHTLTIRWGTNRAAGFLVRFSRVTSSAICEIVIGDVREHTLFTEFRTVYCAER